MSPTDGPDGLRRELGLLDTIAVAAQLLSGPRLVLALARDGTFFRPFARVHARTGTPIAAIALLCGVTLASLWIAGDRGIDRLCLARLRGARSRPDGPRKSPPIPAGCHGRKKVRGPPRKPTRPGHVCRTPPGLGRGEAWFSW